ncbi:hypothetical protein BJY00DRAFT_293391 [Aspergillus carlsbadensis]|nr:hypothetical protein BJY00DRAFT_293391 [Aspergillus carlsbadensis]
MSAVAKTISSRNISPRVPATWTSQPTYRGTSSAMPTMQSTTVPRARSGPADGTGTATQARKKQTQATPRSACARSSKTTTYSPPSRFRRCSCSPTRLSSVRGVLLTASPLRRPGPCRGMW